VEETGRSYTTTGRGRGTINVEEEGGEEAGRGGQEAGRGGGGGGGGGEADVPSMVPGPED